MAMTANLPVSDSGRQLEDDRLRGNADALAGRDAGDDSAGYLAGFLSGILDRNNLVPLRMTGRCLSGAEADGGVLQHAVVRSRRGSWGMAVCGAKPGDRGNGWSEQIGSAVTCARCLRKIDRDYAKGALRTPSKKKGKKSNG